MTGPTSPSAVRARATTSTPDGARAASPPTVAPIGNTAIDGATSPAAVPDLERAVLVYLWAGTREFGPELVNVLADQLRAVSPNLPLVCIQDGFPLEAFDPRVRVIPTPLAALRVANVMSLEGRAFPSCYRRLWSFSAAARAVARVVLLLDLDVFVRAPLEPYFERSEDFVGWLPRSRWGTPGRVAGGTWLHRTGTLPHIWDDFAADPRRSVQKARQAGYRGSDQAYLSHRLRGCAYWPEPHGIYQTQDYGQPHQEWRVPEDARILHFNGSRFKPWHSRLAWIRDLYAPYRDRLPRR